jgi:ribosomal protein S6--L-glutamate ligase
MAEFNFLVLGEENWATNESVQFLFEKDFGKVNLQCSGDNLFFLDNTYNWIRIDGVIWRGQLEVDESIQRYLLEIIKYSGVECINLPDVTLQFGSCLSMHEALCIRNMPVLNKELFTIGKSSLAFTEPSFPCVMKIGNHHMGYGKALVRNQESWQDYIDMAILLNQPVSLEPYMEYKKDIRCQYLNGKVTCIERKPNHWKANVCPAEVISYNPPEEVSEFTKKFADSIGAKILGLDWILTAGDKWFILEGNTSPGLNDFQRDSAEINQLLIERVMARNHGVKIAKYNE